MKYFYSALLFIFLLQFSELNAQTQQALLNRTKHWRFGHKAGLDFNMQTGVPSVFNGSNGIVREGNSCISDTLGNLLFYCTGDTVWNKNHQMMMNGAGMPSDKITILNSVIIPRPGNTNQYFIFINECINNSPAPNGKLKYSLIDMTLDGGNGAVVLGQKNIPVFHHTLNNLAFTKHGNGIDYWLAYSEKDPPYYLCMIPVISSGPDTTNRVVSTYTGSLGFGRFSPANTLFASTSYEVFQFNSNTGAINNKINFPTDSFSNYTPFSCEFSPDSKKIYFSLYQGSGSHNIIQQFDLSVYSATAVTSSLYSFFDMPASYCSCSIGHLQLSPSGKIYIAKPGGTYPGDSIHIIHKPNSLGAACNYQYNALSLNSKACNYSLPIFPDYYFNNIPTLTSFNENTLIWDDTKIYPNPCDVSLVVNHHIINKYEYTIINQMGQVMKKNISDQLSSKIDVSNLNAGLYYLIVNSSTSTITKKIIINH